MLTIKVEFHQGSADKMNEDEKLESIAKLEKRITRQLRTIAKAIERYRTVIKVCVDGAMTYEVECASLDITYQIKNLLEL